MENNEIEKFPLINDFIDFIKDTEKIEICSYSQVKDPQQKNSSFFEIVLKWPQSGKIRFILNLLTSGYPGLLKGECIKLKEYLIKKTDAYGMILTHYISPKSAEICKMYGVGYFDASCNCLIQHPPLFIDIRNPNQYPEKKQHVNIFSGKASRVIHVLLNNPKREWTIKALSEEIGVSESEVYQVKKRLLQEEYIKTGGPREPFKLLDEKPIILNILDKWIHSYNFLRQHHYHYFVSDTPLPVLEKQISDLFSLKKIKFAFTATSAQRLKIDHIRYDCSYLYIEEWNTISKMLDKSNLGLHRTDSKENIVFIEPNDLGVFLGMNWINQFPVVSNIQMYLDLMGYPLRGQEAAEFLLKVHILKEVPI